ncbi:MAG: glycosyltransferase family 39 protein [Vulcanimicrobiaceae bacterium]
MTSLLACPKLPLMLKPRPARAALIGAAIAAIITLPGLGAGTLWDNSETAYGEVAREILLYHDWTVMHLNGAPWFIQPPLYFWVAAFFSHLFGVGSFALRLPSALATIVIGTATGYAVTRQAGSRNGIYAAVILSTCLIEAVVGRLAIMDAMLDLAVALSVFWWFRGLQTGSDRYFILGWVTAALGFLTKGPVAPVAALLVIVPYYFWNRRYERTYLPSWRGWVGSALMFVAIVAPWLLALVGRTGAHSVAVLIGHYTIGRYTGTIENQAGPVWYYIPVLILGFFPWIAFFPSAIAYGIACLKQPALDEDTRNRQEMVRLAFCWIAAPLIFFSLAKTKLPNYIALEFPALALLVAFYFDNAVRNGRSRSVLISAAAVPVTIAMLAIAIIWFSHDNRLTGDLQGVAFDLLFVGAAIFLGSLLTFALLARNATMGAGPYVLGAATTLAVLFLALLALPHVERFKPVPPLAAVIDEQRKPGDVVAIQNIAGGNALVFYTKPRVYVLAPPTAKSDADGLDPRAVICAAPRAWVIAPKNRPAVDPSYGRNRQTIAQSGKAVLFLYDGPRCSSS